MQDDGTPICARAAARRLIARLKLGEIDFDAELNDVSAKELGAVLTSIANNLAENLPVSPDQIQFLEKYDEAVKPHLKWQSSYNELCDILSAIKPYCKDLSSGD